MKIGKDIFVDRKQSFLSVEKNLAIIINKIFSNQDLLKLLYYTEKDCLEAQDLTEVQKYSMINNQIKIVPKLNISQTCPIYMIITLSNYTPNVLNPEFRDCSIRFDILCHPDHWNLGDFQLRPFKIAGELDRMFAGKKLTGIGELNFALGDTIVLNDELMGFALVYRAVQGSEDELFPVK